MFSLVFKIINCFSVGWIISPESNVDIDLTMDKLFLLNNRSSSDLVLVWQTKDKKAPLVCFMLTRTYVSVFCIYVNP